MNDEPKKLEEKVCRPVQPKAPYCKMKNKGDAATCGRCSTTKKGEFAGITLNDYIADKKKSVASRDPSQVWVPKSARERIGEDPQMKSMPDATLHPDAITENKWWYYQDNKRYGSFSAEELRDLEKEGNVHPPQITDKTLVQHRQGSSYSNWIEWKKIRSELTSEEWVEKLNELNQ